jgi:hypothetical protein
MYKDYNIVAVRDRKNKEVIVRYNVYDPDDHTTIIGTYGVKLSKKGKQIPDNTTFKKKV